MRTENIRLGSSPTWWAVGLSKPEEPAEARAAADAQAAATDPPPADAEAAAGEVLTSILSRSAPGRPALDEAGSSDADRFSNLVGQVLSDLQALGAMERAAGNAPPAGSVDVLV